MVRSIARRVLSLFGIDPVAYRNPDFDAMTLSLIREVTPFTMTSAERVNALVRAVEYIVRANVPGAIVECGVWRGGSMMAVARTLTGLGVADRDLYLFDTFEGMTRPGANDVSFDGRPASEWFERLKTHEDASRWCDATVDEVRSNLRATGYGLERIRLVQGKVEDTLPSAAPDQIAILRLDTDWYESTFHELIHLYPRLAPGGVLIVDDYGHWQGSRKAIDEYFASHAAPVLLNRIDYSGRLAIKTVPSPSP